MAEKKERKERRLGWQYKCIACKPHRGGHSTRLAEREKTRKNALRVHNHRRRRVTKATIHYIQCVRWYNWRRREELSLFFSRERVAGAAAAAAAAAFRHFLSFSPPPLLFWAMPCEKRKRARLSGNDDERGATATNVLARFSSTPKNKEKAGEGTFSRAGNKAKLLRKHWDISYCRTGKSIIVSETIPAKRADLRNDFVWGHAASTYTTRPRMHACNAIKLGELLARTYKQEKKTKSET